MKPPDDRVYWRGRPLQSRKPRVYYSWMPFALMVALIAVAVFATIFYG
jgi:hypothetical protein